jgi:hypothetical protein
MNSRFAVTWDYRCPFARNAHTHVVAGLQAGAPWDVRFVPFALGQIHVQEGEPDIWDNPGADTGLYALQAGTVVRDLFPESFLEVHRELFAARHEEGLNLADPDVIKAVLDRHVDTAKVVETIESGEALARVRAEHTEVAASHSVWGVPTFLVDDQAVFVRLMKPADRDKPEDSVEPITRVVGLARDWTDLNEFKHTSITR